MSKWVKHNTLISANGKLARTLYYDPVSGLIRGVNRRLKLAVWSETTGALVSCSFKRKARKR